MLLVSWIPCPSWFHKPVHSFLLVVHVLAYAFGLYFLRWSIFSWTGLLTLPGVHAVSYLPSLQVQATQSKPSKCKGTGNLSVTLTIRPPHSLSFSAGTAAWPRSGWPRARPARPPARSESNASHSLPVSRLLCALPSLPPHGTWCGWIWDSCFCPSASGQGTVDAVGFRPWESTIWAQSKYPKTSHTVKSNNWGVSSMPYYARECYPAPQTWRTLRGKLKARDLSIFAFYLCDKIQVLKTPGVQRRKHDKRLAGSEKQGMSQRKQNLHWLLARGPD